MVKVNNVFICKCRKEYLNEVYPGRYKWGSKSDATRFTTIELLEQAMQRYISLEYGEQGSKEVYIEIQVIPLIVFSGQ